MRRGPKPRKDVVREPNGRAARSRDGRLQNNTMVYRDYAVYFAETVTGFTKVGFSGNLQNRMSMLGTIEGEPVRIVALIAVSTEELARKLERTLHRRFAAKRDHGEWFVLSPGDIRNTLAACRQLKLRTWGVEEESDDTGSPFSSLIGAADRSTAALFEGRASPG